MGFSDLYFWDFLIYQHLRVLRDGLVIKILNPEIIQNLKEVSKIEQHEVQSIILSDPILYGQVNTKYKKWLYQ